MHVDSNISSRSVVRNNFSLSSCYSSGSIVTDSHFYYRLNTNRQTDRHTNIQIDRRMDRHKLTGRSTDGQTYKQVDRQTECKQTDREAQTDKQPYTQTDREAQTDGPTYKQTHRQAEHKQTDREAQTDRHIS